MSEPLSETRREEALALRQRGFGYRRIGRELGISATSVRRLIKPGYAEHLNRLSLEAKRRRTGTCEVCGGETRYHGRYGVNGAARLCAACGAAQGGRTTRELYTGSGPTQQALRELLLAHGEMQFMDIVRAFNGKPAPWCGRLNRFIGRGLVERVERGRYRWIAG